MIKISFPAASEKYYFHKQGFLLGPVSKEDDPVRDSISYRSDVDSLQDSKVDFYGEKSVTHSKLEGHLTFVPALADVTRRPNASFPNSIQWKSLKTTININYGVSGSVGWYHAPSGNKCYYATGSGRHYSIYRASYEPSRDSISKRPYVHVECYSFELRWDEKYKQFLARLYSEVKTVPQKFADSVCTNYPTTGNFAMTAWAAATNGAGKRLVSDSESMGTMYETFTAPHFSPSRTISLVQSAGFAGLNNITVDLPQKDYGDLALQAVSSIDANNVNMIAFLRDLKDPRAMAIKLKNLSKLKTHANNHLAVNYGILPTISDLKDIIAALKKASPYQDRNGFDTHNASHFASEQVGNYQFSLEQRLKIAVNKQDSGMNALADSLENIGLAPTLQNIWDLVPYSFVIDWFINVGDFLERVDTNLRLARMEIPYVTMSRKRTVEVNPDFYGSHGVPVIGSLKLVRYHRWTSDYCPVPPLSFQNTNTASSHWLEAGALIIQRSKNK